ncbi:glycosyltransferase family 2 protein [Myxococcus sp. RHSTA-1-4]|uniref:glycosyltransferase family 2 protein n=1 Tax=Myxococcus sp. RHSTA-1-4 TaxID=2874601 RepID=UPI001CBDE6DA|nr:glycosyltransferase family 2 protein [Myxococcus sp. RHSTA-1-4]MBZ4421558.1 glycosyltransferase family 2 protein [Myxococcus sp. RHSTA-1-4]
MEVSVVIPCLNEVRTLGACIEKALASFQRLGLRGEVVVADNGSNDGSVELAQSLGARVVHVPQRGYGNALRFGMAGARGRWLIMGDADDTYNFEEIGPFVERMRNGAEFVMGTRLGPGKIMPGANPLLNRYVGTPVLTFVLNRLFSTRIRDVNCGMRGLTREAFDRLQLESEGMEFASEMVIKAALHDLDIQEVPVTLYPDRRGRPPHLRRWRDGWRHLKFMLLHAPDQLLFRPGMAALLLGLLFVVPVSFGPVVILGQSFDFHYLFFGGTLVLMGMQGVLGALLARSLVGGVIIRPGRFASALANWLTFGRGLAVGGALLLAGLVLEAVVVGIWLHNDMRVLMEPRRSVLGMLLMGAGAEVALFSFLLAVLKTHSQPRQAQA